MIKIDFDLLYSLYCISSHIAYGEIQQTWDFIGSCHEVHNPGKYWKPLPGLCCSDGKKGKTFVPVLDNIDWELKVHDMRSDKQNKSVHAVATSTVFDRVASDLHDNGPKKCLSDCNMKDFLKLSDKEQRCTRERYKIYIGRILFKLFPAFQFLSGVVPVRTPCRYQAEMSCESVVVPLPVLMKNEK